MSTQQTVTAPEGHRWALGLISLPCPLMQRFHTLGAVLLAVGVAGCALSPLPVAPPPELGAIDEIATQEISTGATPGVVILVGRGGEVLYRRAFGDRSRRPTGVAMTPDTLFDIASLTKVVATTPAILHLADQGKLELDVPVSHYWPQFGANGKGSISLRQLLTHFSGLRPDVDPQVRWSDEAGALAAIAADRPLYPPGSHFSYSDANFIVLGELVRRVSGLPLDQYCSRYLFAPIGMGDTGFRPSEEQRPRIAPSDVQGGQLRWGQVQDPTAYRMGGVAGHAGLFSTADDLAAFARLMLNGGRVQGVQVLSTEGVGQMLLPQSPPGQSVVRGLGWDIRSPYSRDHSAAFPHGSFGHTGYTGASLWIDPVSGTYLIILANRLHPYGRGQVHTLRAKIAALVAQVMGLSPGTKLPGGDDCDAGADTDSGWGQSDRVGIVRVGIEVLAADGFQALAGRGVGLVVNHTARDASGRRTLDLHARAPGVRLVALFSPEHGLEGDRDEKVPSWVPMPRRACPSKACKAVSNDRPLRCCGGSTPWCSTCRTWVPASTLTSRPWPIRWRRRIKRGSSTWSWTDPTPSGPIGSRARCGRGSALLHRLLSPAHPPRHDPR